MVHGVLGMQIRVLLLLCPLLGCNKDEEEEASEKTRGSYLLRGAWKEEEQN